jgi:hypothetical protein
MLRIAALLLPRIRVITTGHPATAKRFARYGEETLSDQNEPHRSIAVPMREAL